jgi:hypothetical protein
MQKSVARKTDKVCVVKASNNGILPGISSAPIVGNPPLKQILIKIIMFRRTSRSRF